MPLVPQTIDIPFAGGLDTSTDPKKVVPGKLLELENARFIGTSLEIRSGTSLIPDGVASGGALTEALGLHSYAQELLRWTSGGVYGLTQATASPWVRRADAVDARSLMYGLQPVAQRARSCENFDMATCLGVAVCAWTEGEPGGNNGTGRRVLRMSVVDEATGARYQDAVEVAADSNTGAVWRVLVRVVATGGQIVVFFGLPSALAGPVELRAVRILPGSPTTFSASTLVTSNMSFNGAAEYPYTLDAIDLTTGTVTATTTGTLALAYGATDGVRLAWYTLNPTGNFSLAPLGVEVLQAPSPVTAYARIRLARLVDGSRLFLLFNNTSTLRLEAHTYNAATRVKLATADMGAFRRGRLAFAEPATGTLTVLAEFHEAGVPQALVARNTLTAAGTAGGFAAWARGVRIVAGGARVGGFWVVPALLQDCWTNLGVGADLPGAQPTVVLLDAETGRVVGRALVGEAGGPLTDTWLPASSASRADGSAVILLPRRGRTQFDQVRGKLLDETPFGLVRMDARAADVGLLGRTEAAALHSGGAAPSTYDGAAWVEDGFHTRPEGLKASVSGITGQLPAGTYAWTVCYEWRDSLGRLHRSAPAVPVSFVVPAPLTTVAIYVPLPSLTRRKGVTLALYRTQASGTVFYRVVDSRLADVSPDPGTEFTSDTFLYDGFTDASIADNEVLPYGGAQGGVVGGELWHLPPPAYSAIHQHQDYLFTNSLDDPYGFSYSLPIRDGEAPAWAAELRGAIPRTCGALVGFSTLDDKLILHAEDGAYALIGRGPLNNGLENGFSEPVYVAGSSGCRSAVSVVATPDGVMFQGRDGFYLLSRALETVKLGAPVDAFSSLTVVRALEVRVPASTANPSGRREVRWYTREGRTLVYDLVYRQWGTDTGQPARDAQLLGRLPYFADGVRVRREDASSILEAGTPFAMLIGTAWLRFGAIVGLERVWRVVLLGRLSATCKVRSEIFHDYQEASPGSTNEQTYSGATVGGPEVFQLRQTPGRQLCTALRMRWTLTPQPTGPNDTGRIGLTSLTLEVGVHPRASKRRQQSIGG